MYLNLCDISNSLQPDFVDLYLRSQEREGIDRPFRTQPGLLARLACRLADGLQVFPNDPGDGLQVGHALLETYARFRQGRQPIEGVPYVFSPRSKFQVFHPRTNGLHLREHPVRLLGGLRHAVHLLPDYLQLGK